MHGLVCPDYWPSHILPVCKVDFRVAHLLYRLAQYVRSGIYNLFLRRKCTSDCDYLPQLCRYMVLTVLAWQTPMQLPQALQPR